MSCVNPCIITTPFAIYLIKIEELGRSQFVHDFRTPFVTWTLAVHLRLTLAAPAATLRYVTMFDCHLQVSRNNVTLASQLDSCQNISKVEEIILGLNCASEQTPLGGPSRTNTLFQQDRLILSHVYVWITVNKKNNINKSTQVFKINHPQLISAVNRSLLSFEYKICRFSISMTICAFITIKSNHRSITQPLLSVHYIPDPTTNCRKKAFSFSAHFKAPLFGVNWIRVLEKCIKYKHGLKSNRRDSEFNCRQKTKPHES